MKFLTKVACVFILITVADAFLKDSPNRLEDKKKAAALRTLFFGSIRSLLKPPVLMITQTVAPNYNDEDRYDYMNEGICLWKICTKPLKNKKLESKVETYDEKLEAVDAQTLKQMEAKLRLALRSPRFFKNFIGSL
jgi:hypothetical protein